MAIKLRRNVASYEALVASHVPHLRPETIARLVADAQVDIGALADANATLMDALKAANEFMTGFEGDELQQGIGARLALIRDAIASAEVSQ